ncbi:ATP-binding protein [Baekduia soli]|uniref:ATP-binding protein n=1 Tax=Baekduia soli TaxID=496014 RepID=UPI002AA2ADAC|nr:ATP-binding protein [Baekduia soli]
MAYAKTQGVIDLDGVALAVSEAVTNVVLHAYLDDQVPGVVEVVAASDGDAFEVRVCDDGRRRRPRPDSPGVGAGLPLIATLTTSLDIGSKQGGGTRLVGLTPRRGQGLEVRPWARSHALRASQ